MTSIEPENFLGWTSAMIAAYQGDIVRINELAKSATFDVNVVTAPGASIPLHVGDNSGSGVTALDFALANDPHYSHSDECWVEGVPSEMVQKLYRLGGKQGSEVMATALKKL
jgi:hypothetical protein